MLYYKFQNGIWYFSKHFLMQLFFFFCYINKDFFSLLLKSIFFVSLATLLPCENNKFSCLPPISSMYNFTRGNTISQKTMFFPASKTNVKSSKHNAFRLFLLPGNFFFDNSRYKEHLTFLLDLCFFLLKRSINHGNVKLCIMDYKLRITNKI